MDAEAEDDDDTDLEDEISLSLCLSTQCYEDGQYEEAIFAGQACFQMATKKGNENAVMTACLVMGESELRLKEYEDAVSHCMASMEIATTNGDFEVAMKTCLTLGKAHCALGQYDEALKYTWMCMKIAKEIANSGLPYEGKAYLNRTIQCALMLYNVTREVGDKNYSMHACYVIMKTYESLKQYKEAVDFAEIFLGSAKEIGNKRVELKTLRFIAGTQFAANNHTEAVRYAKLSLELAKETGDQGLVMEACELIAAFQSAAGNKFEAVHYAEMRLEFAKKARDKREEVDTCYFIAGIQCEAGNFTEAVKYGLMCAGVAKEIGDKHSEIDACFLIGNAGRALESFDEILQYATKRMTMEQESDEGGNKKIGCLLLGLVHHNMKKYDEALSHFRKAIDHAREERDVYGEMKIYHCLSETHCHLQQIHNATSCCEKSIQIATKIGAKEWEMKRSLRLAQFYKTVNRSDKVKLHATASLEIAKKLGDKEIQRDANIFLGDLYSKSGQDSKASACFNESIDIAKKTGNTFTEFFASSLVPLSSVSDLKKRNEKMLDMLKGFSLPRHTMTESDFEGVFTFFCSIHDWLMQLIKFCADDDSTELVMHSYEKLLEQVKPQNSLEFSVQPLIHSLEKSIDVLPLRGEEKTEISRAFHVLAEKSANKFPNSLEEYLISLRKNLKISLKIYKVCEDVFCSQATCHSILGMTHYLLNDVPNAKASFIEATNCFESLFNGVGVDKSKISIVDRYADTYKLLSIILIQEGKIEEALAMAENCRAKALKDILILMYGLDKKVFQEDDIEFDDILHVLKAQKSSILFYTVSFHGIHKFVMEDEKDLQFSAQPLVLPDLRFKNLIKEVYKEMEVSKDFHCRSPLWLNRAFQLFECDDSKEMFTRMSREWIEKNALTKYGLNLGDLEECDWEGFDDLLEEEIKDTLENDPGYRKFEENSMPSPLDAIEGKRRFTSALEALSHRLLDHVSLEQDDVVIIPDGLLSIVPFAALTNPATGNYLSEDKKIRFAPSLTTLKMLSESRGDFHTLKDAILIGDPDVSRVQCGDQPLTQLPFAEKEVKVIAHLYFKVTPLIGAQATKRAVLEKLREGASVVHIAAHGNLDKATILLAPDPDVPGVLSEEDYMLNMADVQQAQVRAQLVVLSCCYSGRGEIKAEGVVGMCRAFLASGARAVVASLWAIDDEASHVFMVEFYGYLQDGNSASTSLQMAMNELREMEEYSEPKYWAPFFLMGDDVTIKF